jgi:hypothetical protein
MANNSIDTIIKMATELKAKMGEDEKQIPAWIQDHIAKAENLISQASGNYHEYGDSNESVVNEDNTAFETLMLIRNLEQTNKLLAQDLKTSKRLPNDKKENIKKSIVVNQGLINYYKETYKNLKNNESVNEAAPCWKGYKQVGMKDKGGRQVPNCVPNESVVNEAPIPIKDGKYHFYYKDGVGYLEFNGKKISSGDYDMEDGSNSYWMSHSSFKGSQKAFKTGKDIVNYFKSKKITTESVNEASNTGEKIQNLNNRIKVLRDKISATKSPEQKKLHSDRLKNALQSLSNIKKDFGIKKEASGRVPQIFLKTGAVEKKIKELMADRKKAVVPYNSEKDPTKKESLKQILIKLTKQIQGYEKNLIQLRDKEEEYIQQMNADAQLDVSAID